MNKNFERVGQIQIQGGHIDITDPCYNSDVWCRTSVENMAPGLYDCMVEYAEDGHYRYVSRARIVFAGGDENFRKQHNERLTKGRSWRNIGEIGVDAGIAGFFDGSKPDFSDEKWSELCTWMNQVDRTAEARFGRLGHWYILHFGETNADGFWTSSGYGDGGYPVFAIQSIMGTEKKTTAVEIRFL